jgi:hypothetical protein
MFPATSIVYYGWSDYIYFFKDVLFDNDSYYIMYTSLTFLHASV